MSSLPDQLNDLARKLHLTPLEQNIAVCFLSALFFKMALEGIAWMGLRFPFFTVMYRRSSFYVTLSLGILFWPLYDTTTWSWRLNTILPLAVLVRFFYKGVILKDSEDVEVQTLSNSASPSELLFGPSQFAAVLVFLGLYRFQTHQAAVVVAACGIGDAMAPIFGEWFGRHPYQMPLASQKTMEGSVCGVFMGSCSASYFFLFFLGIRPFLPLRLVMAYGAIAAMVEGSCPDYMDNLAVPVALICSMARIEQLLDDFSSFFAGGDACVA